MKASHRVGPLPAPIRVFAERLANADPDTLHVLTAAGVGDAAEVNSKFWSLAEQRPVKFWYPKGEFERTSELYRLWGLEAESFPNLTTGMVWDYWDQYGDPPMPSAKAGGVRIVSASRHQEQGNRLEDWYPNLPWRNPAQAILEHPLAQTYKLLVDQPRYVLVAMGGTDYHTDREMVGNLLPAQWAKVLRKIEQDIAPVVLQFSQRSQSYAQKVMEYWGPTFEPAVSNPYPQKLVVMKGAQAVVGHHSGDMMMACWAGCPTFEAYPRWLRARRFTYQHAEAIHDCCFSDELTEDGIVERIAALIAKKKGGSK